MEITPRELRDIEIHSEIRGYSRDEVNDLLERAAAAIEASNQRVTQLQDRLTSAQSESVGNRETEDILHRTLLLAQRAADEAVAEATAKARQMVDEAEMSSRRLVAESEAEARRRGETERRRLEQEIVELAGRRDTLLADVEALTRFEAEYRERMVRSLETDLTSLRARATTAPGSKPEPSEVEIPAAITPVSSGAASSGTGSSGTGSSGAGPSGPGSSMIETPDVPSNPPANPSGNAAPNAPSGPAPGATSPATSTNASNASKVGVETAEPDADAPADHAGESSNGAGEMANSQRSNEPFGATSEVDVRTLWEQSHEKPRDASNAAPASESSAPKPGAPKANAQRGERGEGGRPIDLSAGEGVDADVLDDDAFFATLRDAVHDEKPLGPREEGDDPTGENTFFDQDADRGTFRDVFRRRR
jgi:cell division septum initiation protein DivIVA